MTPQPKFWTPRFQQWASLDEIEYLKMQVRDSELCVRETPAYKVSENWAAIQARGVR